MYALHDAGLAISTLPPPQVRVAPVAAWLPRS